MTATACCAAAACCPAAIPALPSFAVGGAGWPAALGFALLAAGSLAAGWVVLAQVARAFGATLAAP